MRRIYHRLLLHTINYATNFKFSLFCLSLLCFSSVFRVIYLRWILCLRCWRWCHWYPSLGIAYQLIVIWQPYFTRSVCHPLLCNASACYPSNLYVMYNTYQFPILSDSLFNTPPPEMRTLYHLSSLHQLSKVMPNVTMSFLYIANCQ